MANTELEKKRAEKGALSFYHFMMLLCLAVHSFLIILFFYMDVFPMIIMNGVSSFFYFMGVVFVKNTRKIRIWLLLVYSEIIVHSVLCNMIVGWGYGFELYAIMLIPAVYYVTFLADGKDKCFKEAGILNVINIAALIISTFLSGDSNKLESGVSMELPLASIFNVNLIIASLAMIMYSVFFVKSIAEINEKLETKGEELNFLATHDALTGLRNRHYIQTDFDLISSGDEPFCLLLGDVDDFKKINDTYGHNCGDHCLIYVADTIDKIVGDDGIVCRWGGEEFLAIMRLPGEEGIKRAEEICQKLREVLLQFETHTVAVTMTIGFATGEESKDGNELIRMVDDRLYIGKNNGKNQVVSEG
ncbi:MAG: GGDEF domain-containing protein [Eubacterium sp.]|nr:GGDEF domain-containing protein [Eubacterium sp.]